MNNYLDIGLKTYMNLQKIEIDEHKWYLSQYCNRDVGYNEAVDNFIKCGYADLFRINFFKNYDKINDCKLEGQLEKLIINHDADLLHKLLGDK